MLYRSLHTLLLLAILHFGPNLLVLQKLGLLKSAGTQTGQDATYDLPLSIITDFIKMQSLTDTVGETLNLPLVGLSELRHRILQG